MGSDRVVARCRASLLVVCMSVTVALVPVRALADPTAADRETARTLMKQGDKKFAAKDFAGALKDYQAAHAIMGVATTGLAVANAQIERGQLIEARETLLEVDHLPADPYESATLAKARDEAAALAKRLAQRIPTVTITVDGPTTGVELRVDGAVVPPAALGTPRKANPGAHVISASAFGYATATVNVVLREGANERVVLKLSPGTAALPPVEGGGVIHVASPDEPGNVFLDGKAAGATPLAVPASAGKHEIEVQYPGGSHDKRTVDVKKGETVELAFRPSALDAMGRHRKGVHLGIAGGPAMAAYLTGGPALFGGTVSFVFHVGIIPMFELRSGVKAAFVNDTIAPAWQFSAVVPVMLQVNYSSYFSIAAGLSVGFVDNAYVDDSGAKAYQYGYTVGPEWTPLIMATGDRRQFELSIAQGVGFGNVSRDFHQAVVFTYLFLD
jgi:hypothetical protein